MSQKSENRKSYSTKSASSTLPRTTIIQRGVSSGAMPVGSRSSVQMRMSMGSAMPNYSSGQVSQMSHKGVSNVMENRAKEKTELTDLNNRFACYIEKVRFLECQNTSLLDELAKLKKSRMFDPSSIKAIYEDEINECRNIIKDMSEDKAKTDAKLVDLEDGLESLQRDYNEDEETIAKLQQKIEALNKENADLDGEVSLLRRRVDSQEDEINRSKKERANLLNDLQCARADLEKETCARLQKEFELQGEMEALDCENKYLEETIAEYKKLANRDTSTEMTNVWKDQIRNVTEELTLCYDKQLNDMSESMKRKYEMQIESQMAGLRRDNSEALMAKEETKSLKGKMSGLQPRLSQLEAENAALMARLKSLQEDYDCEVREHEDDNSKLQMECQKLSAEIETIMKELMILQDAKLGLELEISCYRKLLECEENSMRKIVETSSGARSAGAQQLSEIISGGGGGGGGSSEQKSTMSELSNKIIVQRTCKGDVAIDNAQPDGSCVTLKNTSKKDIASVSLKGWSLRKTLNGVEKVNFKLPDINLAKGKEIKLFSKGAEEKAGSSDIVCEHFSWGLAGAYSLCDGSGVEKATLTVKTAQ